MLDFQTAPPLDVGTQGPCSGHPSPCPTLGLPWPLLMGREVCEAKGYTTLAPVPLLDFKYLELGISCSQDPKPTPRSVQASVSGPSSSSEAAAGFVHSPATEP